MGFLGDLLGKARGEAAVDYTSFYVQESDAPPAYLATDTQYVRVWLRSAHLTEVRRWTTKFVPAVHARFAYADRSQGTTEVMSVVSPGKSFEALDPRNLNRLVTANLPLLGPLPFRGDLSMEVALFSVAGADLAQPYLELLSSLTDAAGVAFLGSVKPFVEPLRRGAELLFSGDGAQLEIGMQRADAPLRTGNIVLARTPKGSLSPGDVTLDPNDWRLLDAQGRAVSGFPYMVLGIEALNQRADYAKIPELLQGWNDVRTAAQDGQPDDEVLRRFTQLRRTIWLSPDLVQADKKRITGIFHRELADAGYGTAPPPEAAGALESMAPARPLRSANLLIGDAAGSALAEPVSPNAGDDAEVDAEQRAPARDLEGLEAAAPPWRVAESLLQLRRQVDALFPLRSRKSDGTIGDAAHQSRSSDHNPWVQADGMGVVTGMDITHDPNSGCSGNRVAEALRAGRDPRVKYIIWNRRICSATISPWQWRPYGGSNPHEHHVHLSVVPEVALYDADTDWVL